mmetsp:Transcript_107001/g.330594  ORF Transcript_107001/g.330594 Transcript_107001/m.330594 type:complete len:86 (-) Transcript_107001:146-403(-)
MGPRRLTVEPGLTGLKFDHACLDQKKMGIGDPKHSHTKKWPTMTSTERSVVLFQVARLNRALREKWGDEHWQALPSVPAQPKLPA